VRVIDGTGAPAVDDQNVIDPKKLPDSVQGMVGSR